MNVYQTQPGNPLVSGWVTITMDLTSLLAAQAGQTLRLRFAEADNVNFLLVGVDNVSLTVPEPTTCWVAVGGLGFIGVAALRKRRRGAAARVRALMRLEYRARRPKDESVRCRGRFTHVRCVSAAGRRHRFRAGRYVPERHRSRLEEGGVSPNPPANIATGGPAGSGDRYLQNIATGGSGAGSRMVMFNARKWTGDYLTQRIDRISAQLANFGSTTLYMRVAIRGGSNSSVYCSASPFILAPDGRWRAADFDLTAAALTNVGGANTLEEVLSNVIEVRFFPRSAARASPEIRRPRPSASTTSPRATSRTASSGSPKSESLAAPRGSASRLSRGVPIEWNGRTPSRTQLGFPSATPTTSRNGQHRANRRS
jgi:hypothetical protein